jgi:hypothetical protein
MARFIGCPRHRSPQRQTQIKRPQIEAMENFFVVVAYAQLLQQYAERFLDRSS